MARRFVAMFAEEVPKQLQILADALQSEDAELANLTAHALKAQLSYFGAAELSALARRIEVNTEHGDFEKESTMACYGNLEAGLQALLQQLEPLKD